MPASTDAARPDPRGPRHPAGPAGRRARRAALRVRRRPSLGGDVVPDAGHPGGDACRDPRGPRGARPAGVHGPGQRDGRGPGLDLVLRLGPADRARRDRVHVLRPALVGHHEQPRLQAADAHARVRDVGLRPRGVPCRRPQQPLDRGDPTPRRGAGGRPAQPPAGPRRHPRRQRVLLDPDRRVARRSAPAWRRGSAQRGDRPGQVRLAGAGVPAGEREALGGSPRSAR